MLDFDPYQIQLFKDFVAFRKPYEGPAYPPYHQGFYLEEFFYHNFLSMGKLTEQYYVPVFWTNCYLSGTIAGLQEALDRLDPEREYFCVSQHDDAVKEKLPPKTLFFNAGGNKYGTPIPLVCSSLSYPQRNKKTFCSFVGSNTHPIREKMIRALVGKDGFEFYCKDWTSEIETAHKDFFLKKTAESLFSLCPRGYGASSFRFYESLQLGSVPVFIYDKPWFPYEDILDWDSFSVRVHESDIIQIPEILVEKAPFVSKMVEKGQEIYDNFFSLSALPTQIYKILNYR